MERANAPDRRAEPATSWLVGSNTINLIGETNQPVADDDPAAEIRRIYALLRDPEVDVAEIAARRIAKTHRFEYVLGQVFTWRHARARGKALAPGAIVNRLDNSWRPDDLTAEDRASDLYRRHVTPEMRAAQEAQRLRESYAANPDRLQQSAADLRKRYGRKP